MILFCLPQAGGSASIYYKWKKYLHPSIKLRPIELKGRGKRLNQELYDGFDQAVDDIINHIKNEIFECDCEYAIYGHSLGSILAYESYYRICEDMMNKPCHLFFSGYPAPNIKVRTGNIHKLDDDEFIKRLIEIGGIKKEAISNKGLMSIYLPMIKNDFKIIEEYNYKNRQEKISCDMSIFYGKQDDISLNEVIQWENHCSTKFEVYGFDGDHFFMENKIEDITAIINKKLIMKQNI